jgi:hypothetical protein
VDCALIDVIAQSRHEVSDIDDNGPFHRSGLDPLSISIQRMAGLGEWKEVRDDIRPEERGMV